MPVKDFFGLLQLRYRGVIASSYKLVWNLHQSRIGSFAIHTETQKESSLSSLL